MVKAAKYLILPPDYAGDVPTGYIPLRPKTNNTSTTLLYSLLASRSEEDVRKGDEVVVKQVKIYPLKKASNPPEPRFIYMTGKLNQPRAR